jgi:hypothetical protein
VSTVQVVRHAVAPQAKGGQGLTTAEGHCADTPLHVVARVSCPPLHEAARHCVALSNASTGQPAFVPSQTSGLSQTPFFGRQPVPGLPGVNTQPDPALQESTVQTLPSSHGSAGPPAHAFPEQVSAVVQAFPSSQGFVFAAKTQPVAASQESSVQTLLSLQVIVVPVQAPAPQTSPLVQALPSSQPPPFASLALHDLPDSLQLSLQLGPTSVPGQGVPAWVVHAPVAQVSAPLQNTLSSHAVPVWLVHVPGDEPLHVWQSVTSPPPHALVQHTVSTHVSAGPLWLHIEVRKQEPPVVTWGSHLPIGMLQKKPPGHCPSLVHAPWHAEFDPSQGVAAPHAVTTGGGQSGSVPLQAAAAVCCALGAEPVQEASRHDRLSLAATGTLHWPDLQTS